MQQYYWYVCFSIVWTLFYILNFRFSRYYNRNMNTCEHTAFDFERKNSYILVYAFITIAAVYLNNNRMQPTCTLQIPETGPRTSSQGTGLQRPWKAWTPSGVPQWVYKYWFPNKFWIPHGPTINNQWPQWVRAPRVRAQGTNIHINIYLTIQKANAIC